MAYTKTTWVTGSTPLSAANMNHIEQGIKDAHDLIANITNTIFPVGAYFETSDANFNPNGTFAGTWILEKGGQVHVSAGSGYSVNGALSNQSDGGSKDAVIPYHSHSIPALSGTAASGGAHTHTINASTAENGAHAHSVSGSTNNTGAHTHVPGSPGNTDAGFCAMRNISQASGKMSVAGGTASNNLCGWGAGQWSYLGLARNTGSAGSHTHTFSCTSGSAGKHTHTISANSESAGGHTHGVTTDASTTGAVGSSGNTANANMMPYIVVYRWHRTA